MSDATATSEPSPKATLPIGESIAWSAASRARTSATPDGAPVLAVNEAGFSTKRCESFASWSQDSLCWRTSQRCLLEGWTPFSERWPRSGLMRSGTVYRLPPLVRRISGIGSSSWPTPCASTNRKSRKAMTASTDNGRRSGGGNSSPPGLEQCVQIAEGIRPTELPPEDQLPESTRQWMRRWPTPTAADASGHAGEYKATATHHAGTNLATAVRKFPTPTARDYKSGKGQTQEDRGRKNGQSLAEVSGGQLNPQWVEWLMGFPLGWTDLEG